MWNPFRARREHELRLAQIQADTQRYLADSLRELGTSQARSLESLGDMVKSLAEGQAKSSEILKTWLDSFKVLENPESTVVRDEDEIAATIERVMDPNTIIPPEMPEGLPPEFQLAWLLRRGESSVAE